MPHIIIDEERCTACGSCMKACQRGPAVFRMIEKNGKVICEVIDESWCLGCRTCVGACRSGALKISDKENQSGIQ